MLNLFSMKTKFIFLISTFIILLSPIDIKAQIWESQAFDALPENYGVFSISVVDENVVWAVAIDQENYIGVAPDSNHMIKVLKTIDGGNNWEVFEIKEAIGRVSLHIIAMDSNTAFITTNNFRSGNNNNNGLFKTTDGGVSWTEIYADVAAGVWVHFFDDQEGIVINHFSMAKTTDGGETWTRSTDANLPAFNPGELVNFFSGGSGNNSFEVVGDNIWFTTITGRVHFSKDRGETWDATLVVPNTYYPSITFKDELNGIIFNYQNSTIFSVTHDGGVTWELFVSNHNGYITDMTYVPGTEATLIATSYQLIPENRRVSILSRDFGQTWETLNQYIPMVATDFISPTVGWTGRSIVSDPTKQEAMYKWSNQDIVLNLENLGNNEELVIFPNPFEQVVTIKTKTNNPQEYTFKIYDSSGKIYQSGTINATNSSMDFGQLAQGIYFLEINRDGRKTVRQIVKAN